MSGLANAIKRREKTIGVVRYREQTDTSPRFNGGKTVRPRAPVQSTKAVVLPIDGKTTQQLTEGEREVAELMMYSRFLPVVSSTMEQTYSDVIVYQGRRYKVLRVWDRRIYGCYFKSLLSLYRERPQDNETP